MAAVLAGVRGAIRLPVMLRDLPAGRAIDAVWVEPPDKMLKASGVVGKLALKLHKRVTRLRSGGTFWVISVYLRHTKSILDGSTAVKGIIAIRCSFLNPFAISPKVIVCLLYPLLEY
jgi:hypothetical protein